MAKSKSPSFVLTLKLNTNTQQDSVLDYRFACGCRIHNTLVRHCRKQLAKLESDSLYKELLSARKQNGLSKSDIHDLNKQLADIRMSYGLSEYQLHDYVKVQQHRYKKHIDSLTAQKIATHVWQAVDKYLFSDGKTVHFCKYTDFHSMEGKNNASGIRFQDCRLYWNGLIIQPKYNRSDVFAIQALKCPVKYCRIKRMIVGTKYHYYLQLVLTGIPPKKHSYGTGDVGIDIGPSSVAVCADDYCALENLADSITDIESKKRCLSRKLDRSRRTMNPGNYNPDGTVIKNPERWINSNTYRKTRMQYINACRKRSASLKQRQEILSNIVLSHGSKVYIETMSFKGLQARSKKTERNADGKYKRKKRFGKSIGNCAPSQFVAILNRKLGYIGAQVLEVNTVSFRASQYNHVKDDYVKKKLSQRWNNIGGQRIQRDLYSAFLLKNSVPDLTHTDRDKCLKTFDTFKINHNLCINTLKHSTRNLLSSFGIKKTA